MTEKELISMGYRKLKENIFGKPFGTSLYVFELDKQRITQWFKNASDREKNEIWNSRKCITIEELKIFEVYSHSIDTKSNFEFLTIEDLCNYETDFNFS